MATDLELTHAIFSTGDETTSLPGGRSRRTANDVPVLELRSELAEKVSEAARVAVDPEQDTEYKTGATVILSNEAPHIGVVAGDVIFHVGGETLDEAAKSIIGRYELTYGQDIPEWVWSTDDDLAEVIADHYNCENRNLS